VLSGIGSPRMLRPNTAMAVITITIADVIRLKHASATPPRPRPTG
jgi:hypothetical protein